MAYPTRTYTFANSTAADATQVNQNFTDVENGFADGTKDYNMNQGTLAGKFTAAAAFVTSGVSTVVATAAGSSTVADTTSVVILAPAATIASYTLTLPAAPAEGQRLSIVTNANEITALTITPNTGHTAATGSLCGKLTAGMAIHLVFRSTVWYRIGSGCPRQPTIQTFTSGSGTYTTPSNVSWIRVRMVGGGGGGGAQTTGAGSNGGDTTFGTGTAVKGSGGAAGGSAGSGGDGGTASLGSGWIGVAISGGRGGRTSHGSGAATPFGGAGGASTTGSWDDAKANTGSGGSGGATTGAGGGAGGYIDAIINSPATSYSYGVGAGGAGGNTSGTQGGAGAAGIIIVEEHYT